MRRNRFASLLSLLVLVFLAFQAIDGADTIEQGQHLTYPNTIISAGGEFELGFFSPGNTAKHYVGIWHKVVSLPYTVLNLSINGDGKLVISDDKSDYKVTDTTTSRNTEALLLDSGNLVLRDPSSLEVLWESFDDTTNTILPEMPFPDVDKLGHKWSLVSWRTLKDPAPGSFSLELEHGSLSINNRSPKFHNTSGVGNEYWEFPNTSAAQIVLDAFGQLKLQSWSEDDQRWHTLVSSKCSYHRCGVFSICSIPGEKTCHCLEGFRPIGNRESEGCVRKTKLQCSNEEGHVDTDGFLLMLYVDYPSDGHVLKLVTNAADCKSECLDNCSCIAYAYDSNLGCLVWYEDLFDLKQLPQNDIDGKSFYLKLASSELIKKATSSTNGTTEDQNEKGNNRQLWIIVMLIIPLSMLVLGIAIYFIRKKLQPRGEDLLKFDLEMSLQADDTDLNEANKPGAHRKNKWKLQLFSFASVSAATDNFSVANKLGEGGFGPVHKGVLLKGHEIAVKRLSRRSGQGWEELKNEAIVIAKLQHKNLVRLLGYPIKRRVLDWETRVRITEGIAQGLLYLHQYSRLRIIHRDLKASNILLDSNMNPNISDFGMARIFRGEELQANTSRIVGTYGYMSPEYALEGLFSVKSDVFSFGVLLMEIVSGKKNTGFYQLHSVHLLAHAWNLWTSNREMDLIDPMLEEVPTRLALRYVNIGLLCIQETADDRPTMSDVVSMLSNESLDIPPLKHPASVNATSMEKDMLVQQRRSEVCSVNDATFSTLDAR
ncbi:hypothetical protein ES332_D01G076900v1 [Gossypium tomentosum]|uniref:Receptor-like serine/threonine-protein kinase n=1 Tax=Gossypium tomentosum TaxID=34277 RepID=A0A5D2M6D6_GOSTO|nr:hypothetical protein ES332_D01G076900v1 [Gossypium tomentosum]